MESTTMGLVRGTVIVAFVLGLPAVAFFGVPDEVRTFLDSDFLPWNSKAPGEHADEEHAHADESAPHAHEHEQTPQPPSFFARTDSVQAHYESDDDSASGVALAAAEARVLHQPIYRPQPDAENAEVVRHLPTEASGASASASDDARVKAIATRLRELGALNYQLQRQPDGQFRFVCLCANERSQQQTFEALSYDQLQAMQTVLQQVAAWRGASAANRSTYWR